MKADVSLELFLDGGASVLAKHIELLKAVEHTKNITKAAKASLMVEGSGITRQPPGSTARVDVDLMTTDRKSVV